MRFRAVRFVPVVGKHAHELCAGVLIHLADAAALRPVALGVALLAAVFGQRPGAGFVPSEGSDQPFLDLLRGSPALATYLSSVGGHRTALDLDVDPGFEASVAGRPALRRMTSMPEGAAARWSPLEVELALVARRRRIEPVGRPGGR